MIAALLASALGGSAPAQTDEADTDAPDSSDARTSAASGLRHDFDPSTGRDLLNYPPHRSADLLHERIELVIPDMNVPHAEGVAVVRFAPIGEAVGTLVLQAAELNIRTASCEGRSVTFTAAPGDDRLDIALDPPVPVGQTAEVRIEYEILNPPDGLVWTPESPQFPGRPASLHSQGQSELNRYWFPTHDFPNERFTSEVIVTVPAGYAACSNGRLIAHELTMMPGRPEQEAERFHFSQGREHAPYLVSLAVGQWDVVDVGTFGDRLPMPVYAPPGMGSRVKPVFGRTPKMITLFERLFGEPYPWDKYAQVVVTNFAWGGMENTSATSLHESVMADQTAAVDGDQDSLISHELAHQWFGDLITCRTWEHIWLNEGWATYAEALWEQYRNSPIPTQPRDAGGEPNPPSLPVAGLKPDNDAYQFAIWNSLRAEIDSDAAAAPFRPGLASKMYAYPDAVFNRDANPYPKGAFILHMLRRKLTEPIFWRGVALYVSRHKDSAVETFDFRKCMEDVSGLSLQRFFDQWCFRPGVPHLKVASAWSSEQHTLRLTVEQTQPIDGANPAFFFDLPIWIDDGSGKPRTVTLSSQTREVSLDVPLSKEPRRIVVDPEMHVLADVELQQSPEMAAETLRGGPTLAARLNAARALAAEPGERGVEPLAAIARDSRAFHGLRSEAFASLGRLAAAPRPGAMAALLKLTSADIDDARVRKAAAASLGVGFENAPREAQKSAADHLLARWAADSSYAVRAECLRSLGRLKAVDAAPALAQGSAIESHADVIRIGAIEGLGFSEFPDALDQVTAMAAPGRSPAVRQAAIRVAGNLAAKRDAASGRDRVFNLLSALINDPELRTRQAAVEALLALDDPRSVPTIEQWAAAARAHDQRRWALSLLQREAEERSAAPAQNASAP